MNIKTQYDFPEANLGPDFAKEKLVEFKKLIDSSQSFTVVSMPGVGVSYFLKYLACQDFAYFIHIDLYSLPSLNQHEFYRMFLRDLGGNPDGKSDEQTFIESKEILRKLAQKHEKIVIIFSRFDQLKKELSSALLAHLQRLTTLEAGKIVLIFTAIKPLYEIAPEAVSGGNLAFYSKVLYFTPFEEKDIKKLFLQDHSEGAHPNLDKLIEACGGHNQLFHVILNSHKQTNLLLDKFVKLQLKDLFDYLDYAQRKEVQKIALRQAQGKPVGEVDEYLTGVGYVVRSTILSDRRESKDLSYSLFSPVLEEYIKTNLPIRLPVKEKKLFNLLRDNLGKVVSKDEIFESVWPARNASPARSDAGGDGQESGATDWALDALVYRLRKHPFIKAHGYLIESQKKVGYTLIQT